MLRGSIHHVVGHVLPFILLGVVIGIFWHVFNFYTEHKIALWLQAEEIIDVVTFPYKLAELRNQEKATHVPIPVHDTNLSEISDTWGEARSEGRTHEGVDIFAERGTPVYAATHGYVIRAGENPLGGTSVFTIGPGGVRYYYAHLEKIAEGIESRVPVTTDTVIGFIGNSGNASGTPPHLHFGIYDNGAQNPYPYLRARE